MSERVIEKHGYRIEIYEIARGMWELMKEDDERLKPLVFGMIPHEIAQLAEREIRAKLVDLCEKQRGIRPDQKYEPIPGCVLDPTPAFNRLVREVMLAWSVWILTFATDEGICVC